MCLTHIQKCLACSKHSINHSYFVIIIILYNSPIVLGSSFLPSFTSMTFDLQFPGQYHQSVQTSPRPHLS